MHNAKEDIELFLQLKSGSEEAWQALRDKYRKLLYYQAFDLLDNTAEAEDMVQELFIRLWIKRNQITITGGNLRAYLQRAIKNRCLDKIEKNKTQKKTTDELTYLQSGTDHDSSNQEYLKRINLQELAMAMKSLTKRKYYPAFIEKYVDQKTYKDIARQMGLQEGAVRKGIHELAKTLKNKLNPRKK